MKKSPLALGTGQNQRKEPTRNADGAQANLTWTLASTTGTRVLTFLTSSLGQLVLDTLERGMSLAQLEAQCYSAVFYSLSLWF